MLWTCPTQRESPQLPGGSGALERRVHKQRAPHSTRSGQGSRALPLQSISQQPGSSSLPQGKGQRGKELVPAGGERPSRVRGKTEPRARLPQPSESGKGLEFTPSGYSRHGPRQLPGHVQPPSLTYLQRAGSTSSLEPAAAPSPQTRAQLEPLGGKRRDSSGSPLTSWPSWRSAHPNWRSSQSTARAPASRSLFQFEQNLIGHYCHSPASEE